MWKQAHTQLFLCRGCVLSGVLIFAGGFSSPSKNFIAPSLQSRRINFFPHAEFNGWVHSMRAFESVG